MTTTTPVLSSSSSSSSSIPDEELRKLFKPNPTKDDILRIIRDNYIVTSSSFKSSEEEQVKVIIHKQLDSYDDVNYLVQIGGTSTNFKSSLYVMKVHNGVESRQYINSINCSTNQQNDKDQKDTEKDNVKNNTQMSIIELQNIIFDCINKSNYDIQTSSPIPLHSFSTSDSDSASILSSSNSLPLSTLSIHNLPVTSFQHSPKPLVVRLLKYLPGTTLSNLPSHLCTMEMLMDAGVYLGKICLALDDLLTNNDTSADNDTFDYNNKKNDKTATTSALQKAATRYHAWDGRNSLDLQLYLPYITQTKRRNLVQTVLHEFQKSKEHMDSSFKKGILMADYNDANIILNDVNRKVDGVIDFGDITYR